MGHAASWPTSRRRRRRPSWSAGRATVEAAAPGTKRTWLKLADGHWSGCNLFCLANDRALGVIDLWRRVEAERKRPWKMAQILGPRMLLRYVTAPPAACATRPRGWAPWPGVRAAIVETPYGLASVDVDKPSRVDLDLVPSSSAPRPEPTPTAALDDAAVPAQGPSRRSRSRASARSRRRAPSA